MSLLHGSITARASLAGLVGLCVALTSTAPRADEGLAPPKPHRLCKKEPIKKKQIKKEHVFDTWPDGSFKAKAVYFLDGTWVQLQSFENGQRKLESYYTKILLNGNPRKTRQVKHGTEKRWHADGQLFVCGVYDKGKKSGTWIYYRENGTPASSFRYVDGKEVGHLTFSEVFGWRRFGK